MKPPSFDPNWSEEVQHVYMHDMQEMWDKSINPHIYNMYQSMLENYLALIPQKPCKILDVGCAQATLALLLAEQGHNVTVVDIRQEFLDYAKTRWTHGNIQFLQGNVLELDLDESFDIIFANQIIEHLVYPLELIQGLHKLLVNNGQLIITTPNADYIKNVLPTFKQLGDPKKWEHMQFTADGDGHFFAYLDTELMELFEQAGMHSTQCVPYETPWISGHMKFRHLHKLTPYTILKLLDRLTLKLPFSKKLGHQLLIHGRK